MTAYERVTAALNHEEVDCPPVYAFVESNTLYDHFAPGQEDLLKAAAISSSGPDIMTMWTGLFALQNQGYLEPLNSYIPADTLKTFNGIDWCSKGLALDQGAIFDNTASNVGVSVAGG